MPANSSPPWECGCLTSVSMWVNTPYGKRIIGIYDGMLGLWPESREVIPLKQCKNITCITIGKYKIYIQVRGLFYEMVIHNTDTNEAEEYSYSERVNTIYKWNEKLQIWQQQRSVSKPLKKVLSCMML